MTLRIILRPLHVDKRVQRSRFGAVHYEAGRQDQGQLAAELDRGWHGQRLQALGIPQRSGEGASHDRFREVRAKIPELALSHC